MRSDVRVPRAAGKRLTGTLTRPNVNVPDQNGLAPAVSSSTGSGFRLVLGSALLLLQRRNTLREYVTEIARLTFRLNGAQLRRTTLRFPFDELHHPIAVLVFVILWIELPLKHLDELLRHVQLFLRWRSASRLR